MKSILIAWELGDGLGHLGRMVPLARALQERGHRVWLALKDVSRVARAHDTKHLNIVQAPQWLHRVHGVPAPSSYSEIMLHAGFWEEAVLQGMVKAWHGLFDLIAPNLVVCEHSPVSLVAARARGIPSALFGNGFMCPPQTQPLPAFQPNTVPIARLQSAESRIVRTVNEFATAGHPRAAIERVSDLFLTKGTILTTWKELDHYPREGALHYWGPFAQIENGEEPQWPTGEHQRAFVYLKGEYPQVREVFAALRKNRLNVAAYCPGLTPDAIAALRNETTFFSDKPFSTRRAIAQAHVVVTHGGDTVVSAAAHGGKPQWILPMHAEQLMTGLALERAGLALFTLPNLVATQGAAQVKRLLVESNFDASAQAFASKYSTFDFAQTATDAAAYCETLMNN